MKRSPMPNRRTWMKPGKGPRRSTPLKQVSDNRCCGKATWLSESAAEAALARVVSMRGSDRKGPRRVYKCRNGRWHLTSKGDWNEWYRTVRDVMDRDSWACLICGAGRYLDPHHRKLKSAGGPDTPDNLVTLCRSCHDGVHAHPAESKAAGFIVPWPKHPAVVPLAHRDYGLVLLTADCRYEPVRGDAA